MEQLTLEIATEEPPTFTNFVAGSNREVLATLRGIASGEVAETSVVVWGPPGVGKTHLLRAAVAMAINAGRPARYLPRPALAEAHPFAPMALICVDAVDAADADSQARLFTLYNALIAARGQLVVAASMAPAQLALRDDLRTRLAHGLVYEIVALADCDKVQALGTYARERGFRLSSEAIDYLLAHGRRDMATLVATLAALDRHSLATKRPITVPLLREWMRQQAPSEAADTDVIP
ncbi:MAG TPA: DnaA regulatory inactivator Hda [Casimicrobiaceae bacterium]|jgi:DnaA family protein